MKQAASVAISFVPFISIIMSCFILGSLSIYGVRIVFGIEIAGAIFGFLIFGILKDNIAKGIALFGTIINFLVCALLFSLIKS